MMTEEKEREIYAKQDELFMLMIKLDDPIVNRFLDYESEDMLDEKIDALRKRIDGKKPEEIPDYDKIIGIPSDEEDEDGNMKVVRW